MSAVNEFNVLKTENQPKPKFWNDPGNRSFVFQIILVVLLACVIGFVISNTMMNLEQRGISTGFGFLSMEAGFGIPLSLIEYSEASSYGRTFFVGLLNTLLVSVLGIFFATILGFLIGIGRLSENWLIAKISATYIEIFRNLPLLLQIFFWYYAVLRALPQPRQSIELWGGFLNVRGLYLPSPVAEAGFINVVVSVGLALLASYFLAKWTKKRQAATGKILPTGWYCAALIVAIPSFVFIANGMPLSLSHPELKGFNFKGGMTLIPELAALWLALTIYTAAFIAETVRAGILAVPKGQIEAASALGLSKRRILRLIVIPQAMRVIVPPLTSQYLNLTKNSSLATAIGYPDLVAVFAGTTLNQTGQAMEIITMTMGVYLTISILTSFFMNQYNRRLALVQR